MSVLSPVPNWIIAKKSLPGGMRLAKRPRWYDAEQRDLTVQHRGAMLTYGGKDGQLDPLSQGDYRYWCGLASGNTAGMKSYGGCRGCGMVIHSRIERKEHLKEEPLRCGSNLTRAIKLLMRDRKCVICDLATKRSCWGLPLCSKDCEHEWAFITRQPDALRAALDLVERETS